MEYNKVFGIGLSRTGTMSLKTALERLGLRAVHFPSPELMVARRFSEVLDAFDAATDTSVTLFFPDLDVLYPGSKFVLTTRNLDAWLHSMERFSRFVRWANEPPGPKVEIRKRLYGSPCFDAGLYSDAFRRHHERVAEHFRARPDDLLTIDLCAQPSWSPLCEFLSRDARREGFPHDNHLPDSFFEGAQA